MTTKEAVDHLSKALSEDSSYYYSWQANIAVKFQDVVHRAGYNFPDLHKLSNEAAKEFLNLLIGISL